MCVLCVACVCGMCMCVSECVDVCLWCVCLRMRKGKIVDVCNVEKFNFFQFSLMHTINKQWKILNTFLNTENLNFAQKVT